jgi:hypothetical protein
MYPLLSVNFLFSLQFQVTMPTYKTYSEQILEPSLVYEFHCILEAHVKSMILVLFYTELECSAFIQPWWNSTPNLG